MADAVGVILAVYCVTWTLIGLGLLIGALVLIWKVKQAVSSAQKAAAPTLRQVKEAVGEISEAARDIAGRARHIAEMAEDTASGLRERVDATASVVQEAVSTPFVSLNAVMAGLRRGFEVWRQRTARRQAEREEPPRAEL